MASRSSADLLAEAVTLPGRWVQRWRAEPAAIVVIDPSGVRVTAAMMADWSAGVARRLAAAGVRAGDRVLLSADPSVDLVVSYVALLRLGAVVVPTNPAYTGPELSHVVTDARPVLAVADEPARFAELGLPAFAPQVIAPDAGHVDLDLARPEDLAWFVLHLRHDGAPQGRDAHPRQPGRRCGRACSRPGPGRRTTASCSRCPSSTCTDSASASTAR